MTPVRRNSRLKFPHRSLAHYFYLQRHSLLLDVIYHENMAAVKDSFIDLEKLRLQLEENVKKLRKSLQHWQTWSAEYEGLKEEILGLGEEHTEAELVLEQPQHVSSRGSTHCDDRSKLETITEALYSMTKVLSKFRPPEINLS